MKKAVRWEALLGASGRGGRAEGGLRPNRGFGQDGSGCRGPPRGHKGPSSPTVTGVAIKGSRWQAPCTHEASRKRHLQQEPGTGAPGPTAAMAMGVLQWARPSTAESTAGLPLCACPYSQPAPVWSCTGPQPSMATGAWPEPQGSSSSTSPHEPVVAPWWGRPWPWAGKMGWRAQPCSAPTGM